jgi:hypothetical protein
MAYFLYLNSILAYIIIPIISKITTAKITRKNKGEF